MMTQRIPAQTVPDIYGEALVGWGQSYRGTLQRRSGPDL